MNRSGSHIIAQCRGDILPKYQHKFKSLKEKNEVSRNQRVSKRDMMQTLVHSDAKAISTYFLSKNKRKVYGISSAESNCVG